MVKSVLKDRQNDAKYDMQNGIWLRSSSSKPIGERLAAGDVDALLSLYADDAVLMPEGSRRYMEERRSAAL